MKKIISVVLCLLLLCGCKTQKVRKAETEKIKGVWITYSEINSFISTGFEKSFSEALLFCKSLNITDIFFHVRAFCDAYYKSEIFPAASGADVLKSAIEICHQNGIRIHAWINPYRVQTKSGDINSLPDTHIAKKLYNEDKNSLILTSGIYLNPASSLSKRCVVEGVREIVKNYEVDGIHFDDYFYPADVSETDKESFEAYRREIGAPLSLADFRRAQVNSLISSVYSAIKFQNSEILFSISPAADMDKNYNTYYADVQKWIENGCVDIIIPQLYFGFEYPTEKFRFDSLFNEWKNVSGKGKVKLVIGLAAYKIGTDQVPDNAEWGQNGKDIIKRQEEICNKDSAVIGYVHFSYSYLKGLEV